MMGGDPNAMGGAPMDDPNAGGPMGDAPMDDPNAGGPMGDAPMDDPNAGGTMGDDEQMDGGPMGEDPNTAGEGSDDTMSIINQLSDEDREAVRSYAESMLSRDETQNGDDMAQGDEQPPMMEQVIFTKKQLNMIQENLGPTQDELMDKSRKELPKKQSKPNNSPFSSPKFD